jgi:hypothetical protein
MWWAGSEGRGVDALTREGRSAGREAAIWRALFCASCLHAAIAHWQLGPTSLLSKPYSMGHTCQSNTRHCHTHVSLWPAATMG